MRQEVYATAPLKFSDHRPVYAVFQCTVSVVDETKKRSLSQAIYSKRLADVNAVDADVDLVDQEDLIGYDPITPELPPASSSRRKWWLDMGLPARSDIQAPSELSAINELRPENPFSRTSEPDWLPTPIATPHSHHNSEGHPKVTPEFGGLSSACRTGPRSEGLVSSASADGSASIIRRKPAPSVPKKPDILSHHPVLSAGKAPECDVPSVMPRRLSTTNTDAAGGPLDEDDDATAKNIPSLQPQRPFPGMIGRRD